MVSLRSFTLSLGLAACLAAYPATASADDKSLISQISPGNATIDMSPSSSAHTEIVDLLRQRSYERALPGLEALASTGEAWAMREIGWLYAHGNGVTADSALAFDWFRKSALAGHARSMLLLGTCYARGLGIERNAATAREWLERARQSGDRHVAGSAADEIRRL